MPIPIQEDVRYLADPLSVRIKTKRTELRIPAPEESNHVADYHRINRKFHYKWVPLRKDYFYTENYWNSVLTKNIQLAKQDRALRFFLYTAENPVPVGHLYFDSIVRGVGQHCEFAYGLTESETGSGLMTEAATSAIEYMFKVVQLHRIQAAYLERNERSARLLDRLGFTIEGVAREYLEIAGKWEDHVIASILSSNWGS